MIGMMCIQDWLRQLRPGQSILVLVPTSNYQQQWTGELCYKPIGLRLSPELEPYLVALRGTPAAPLHESPRAWQLTLTAAGMVAVHVRRGPWGHLHEPPVGALRIDALAGLSEALA